MSDRAVAGFAPGASVGEYSVFRFGYVREGVWAGVVRAIGLGKIVGRILAFDYGTKRTGIAVSDPLRLIAGGLETVPTKELETWLAKYFTREVISTIVV